MVILISETGKINYAFQLKPKRGVYFIFKKKFLFQRECKRERVRERLIVEEEDHNAIFLSFIP